MPVGDVNYASTTYQTPYGEVSCRWERKPGMYTMKLTVPANSAACVTLPASTASQVSDYGTPLADAEGISNIMPGSRTGNPNLTFTAASGTYNFQVADPVW